MYYHCCMPNSAGVLRWHHTVDAWFVCCLIFARASFSQESCGLSHLRAPSWRWRPTCISRHAFRPPITVSQQLCVVSFSVSVFLLVHFLSAFFDYYLIWIGLLLQLLFFLFFRMVFYFCDHGLDFRDRLMWEFNQSINQSIKDKFVDFGQNVFVFNLYLCIFRTEFSSSTLVNHTEKQALAALTIKHSSSRLLSKPAQ